MGRGAQCGRMQAPAIAATLAAALLAGCSLSSRDAGEVVTRRPSTYIDIRFESTIRQEYDFSCGAASMATLFTYYYGRPLTEIEALDALRASYQGPDWARTQEVGFSFADLIRAAEHLGFSGEALAIASGELGKLAGPVIVNLDNGVFKHFVVLRQVTDDYVYVADPVTGAEALPHWLFRDQYTGFALALWREGEDLPPFSELTAVRDGISVSNSIKAGLPPSQPRRAPML